MSDSPSVRLDCPNCGARHNPVVKAATRLSKNVKSARRRFGLETTIKARGPWIGPLRIDVRAGRRFAVRDHSRVRTHADARVVRNSASRGFRNEPAFMGIITKAISHELD